MDVSERVGKALSDYPSVVFVVFAAFLLLSVPVITGAEVFISVYDLSPREEYYDHYRVLNRDMGFDNLGAVLLTRPPDKEGINVTEPASVRMMNELEHRFEELEFVEGAYSLAEIVRIMNDRPRFYTEKYSNQTGLPGLPGPAEREMEERSGFPPEGERGDRQIELSLNVALDTLGDQIYGNILTRDEQSALLIVVMEKGADGPQYREWQNKIKEVGLEAQDNVDYNEELDARPLSIDIIYSTLDEVTVEESPDWIIAAALAGAASLLVLFRRFSETSFGLLVLVVVAAGTLAVAMSLGVDLNLLSLMVATLIFAAGIDYAMHVIARYREERELGFDAESAAITTLRSTGPALFVTTVTDTAGFATLYFSLIPAIGRFGAMVAAGLFLSFLTCLTLLPALLMVGDRIRGTAEGEDIPEEELEQRRAEIKEEVRAKQENSRMGRLGAWLADRPAKVVLSVVLVLGIVGTPLATEGVDLWGASYLEPEPILDNDTYAMQALFEMDRTFGIPNELAVMFYGDVTRPEMVQYLDDFQDATNHTHGKTSVNSVPNMLRLYTTFINPDPRIDQNDDGIPDTQEDIRQAYDEMRKDPATKVLLDRVLIYEPGNETEYPVASHRIGIDPQPPNSLGEDVDNYRESIDDVQVALDEMEGQEDRLGIQHGTTGLVKLGVEVVDAIERGNAATIMIMLGVVLFLLSLFWSAPSIGAIGMVPILSAVVVQYGLTSLLDYEITYVSLILTGMVMGIGVDDAVHFITRFREEVRAGTSPRKAASLANAEVGSVLVGTTVTTLAPFIVVIFSIVTWASQTALLVIPTLLAALLGTLIPLPALLAAHARKFPGPYLRGTIFDDKLEEAGEGDTKISS